MQLEEQVRKGRSLTDENGFYHRHTNFGGRYREIRRSLEERINLNDYDSFTVVDIGSSKGKALDTMISKMSEKYKTDFRAYAVDISGEHVREASEKDSIDEAVSGRIEKLPFQDESIDLVVCNGLLPYLPEDPEKLEYTDRNPHHTAFQEIHRILDRGGLAAIEEVNRMPYEQQYLLNREEIGNTVEENRPEEPLRFEYGSTINYAP